jgi:hypothetical protein
MKLNYAPQAGLRRRPPEQRRQSVAFWAGIAILAAFELVLMAKSWSPSSAALIFGYDADRDRSELGQAAAPQADATQTADTANP